MSIERQIPHRSPSDTQSSYAQLDRLIASRLATVRTATLVRVHSVDTPSAPGVPGRISVEPMVYGIAGSGATYEHGIIGDVIYGVGQNGGNAMLLGDPQPGDIGLMAVCDRNIFAVKSTLQPSPPGGRSMFDLSDGVYIATVFPVSAPAQYISMTPAGMNIFSPIAININAPAVVINGIPYPPP